MSLTPTSVPSTATVSERALRRINWRLMPYLVLLYVVAYLDRVNVSYASLQMTRELGFSNTVFGLGGGIFFIGYILLEIPGAILAELWSARKWMARILLTWLSLRHTPFILALRLWSYANRCRWHHSPRSA